MVVTFRELRMLHKTSRLKTAKHLKEVDQRVLVMTRE